jgi:hypothetical protein
MSWLERIKNGIIVTTADGEKYEPEYMNATFVTEYNYTEFNFVDVGGSLVKRKKPIGVKYSAEWYFQGIDHLDVSRNFKNSIDNNEGPIQIEHPLYDRLVVQVTSLNYDNTGLNRTKISGTVIETIEEAFFVLNNKEIDQIPILFEDNLELCEESLTETPQPADIVSMTQSNQNAFAKGVPIIEQAIDYEEYFNAFNTAATFINTATATPILAMRGLINVITMPQKFSAEVKDRIRVLLDTFNSLRANLFGVVTVSSKQIFAAQQAATIAAVCQAAATPLPTDFKLNTQVYETIDQIAEAYSNFVTDMDSLQTDNGGSPLSYVVDASVITNLNQLVNITISNLFNIALNAKSERSLVTDNDTNIIVLTHELYGLDDNDANLNEMIENNDFAIDEYIQIPKGRKITYYI